MVGVTSHFSGLVRPPVVGVEGGSQAQHLPQPRNPRIQEHHEAGELSGKSCFQLDLSLKCKLLQEGEEGGFLQLQNWPW